MDLDCALNSGRITRITQLSGWDRMAYDCNLEIRERTQEVLLPSAEAELKESMEALEMLQTALLQGLSHQQVWRVLSLNVSPSITLPQCLSLAASPSMSLPQCLSLAASPSLPLPRCLSLNVSPSLPLSVYPLLCLSNHSPPPPFPLLLPSLTPSPTPSPPRR